METGHSSATFNSNPNEQNGPQQMKILLVVNSSPWGSTLAVTALRFARAAIAEGMTVAAIFFREDGVFHVSGSRATDAGTPALSEAWPEFARSSGAKLLVCRSSGQRNLAQSPSGAFREAGLAEMIELMAATDRVVTW
jgi:tRNA 2-thiouridine synthesizing protein D